MSGVRADVAAMLRDGATYKAIKSQLQVSDWEIKRTRAALQIPVPPGRARRTPAELAAVEDQAVAMLREGIPQAEINRTLRLSLNRIVELRRQHQIPIPDRPPAVLTVDEAFARYAVPSTSGGHVLWAGPRSGRSIELWADAGRHNPRAVAFTKHHHRAPEGRLRRTCDLRGCIAGAHHADRRIRQSHARADRLYDAIFGPGDPS